MRARIKAWIVVVAGVALLGPIVVGFGLDASELACEQASETVEKCCPAGLLGANSCRQIGGCGKVAEDTLLTAKESVCVREATCERIAASDLCGRIQARIDLLAQGGAAPSIEVIHKETSLCEGLQ